MNIELLKLGAETLGWEWDEVCEAWVVEPLTLCTRRDGMRAWCMLTAAPNNPMLRAHMAEELRRKVVQDSRYTDWRDAVAMLYLGPDSSPRNRSSGVALAAIYAEPDLFIAAALVALEVITTERARGLVQ